MRAIYIEQYETHDITQPITTVIHAKTTNEQQDK